MTNVPSPAAVVTAALAALAAAAGLLGLQIVLGLEYTAGSSLGTQASMIGAMATLALLPVFLSIARRFRAPLYVTAAIAVAFVAFLAYSLPATSGRTGEIKEAKQTVADDVASWRSEHAENAKQLRWAVPDRNAECAGAPDPLPPNGWPNCRRKTGTVTALEDRQAKLEGLIKAAGSAGATGDLGSALWAWALGWFGLTAGAIRKGSVIAFAVGLDFAIWSLIALAEHLAWTAVTLRKATRATVAERVPLSPSEQSDFSGLDADEARKLGIGGDPRPGNWGNSGNGGPKGGNGGGKRVLSRAEALLDVTRRMASEETVDAQDQLADAWGVDKSTVSKWLKRWRRDGLIPAAQRVGRRHRLVAAE